MEAPPPPQYSLRLWVKVVGTWLFGIFGVFGVLFAEPVSWVGVKRQQLHSLLIRVAYKFFHVARMSLVYLVSKVRAPLWRDVTNQALGYLISKVKACPWRDLLAKFLQMFGYCFIGAWDTSFKCLLWLRPIASSTFTRLEATIIGLAEAQYSNQLTIPVFEVYVGKLRTNLTIVGPVGLVLFVLIIWYCAELIKKVRASIIQSIWAAMRKMQNAYRILDGQVRVFAAYCRTWFPSTWLGWMALSLSVLFCLVGVVIQKWGVESCREVITPLIKDLRISWADMIYDLKIQVKERCKSFGENFQRLEDSWIEWIHNDEKPADN